MDIHVFNGWNSQLYLRWLLLGLPVLGNFIAEFLDFNERIFGQHNIDGHCHAGFGILSFVFSSHAAESFWANPLRQAISKILMQENGL